MKDTAYGRGYDDQINNRGFNCDEANPDYEDYLRGFQDATDSLAREANE